MTRFLLFLAVVCAAATAPIRAGVQGLDTTIVSARAVHDIVKGYITRAAEQVPEDKYSYQPTKEVRTMGQLFGHIANASGMFCSTASGMKSTATGDAEKLATKAEIRKALQAAFVFCDHAFDMITPANAAEVVTLLGAKHSRIGAMSFNNAHNFEHYGNIVTYMRINGMVPPSSQGRGGGGSIH
jgi:uncharacterized damage-inducible protein DinB